MHIGVLVGLGARVGSDIEVGSAVEGKTIVSGDTVGLLPPQLLTSDRVTKAKKKYANLCIAMTSSKNKLSYKGGA
jgi:hypothetical protein